MVHRPNKNKSGTNMITARTVHSDTFRHASFTERPNVRVLPRRAEREAAR
jgi:hypothetical protein